MYLYMYYSYIPFSNILSNIYMDDLCIFKIILCTETYDIHMSSKGDLKINTFDYVLNDEYSAILFQLKELVSKPLHMFKCFRHRENVFWWMHIDHRSRIRGHPFSMYARIWGIFAFRLLSCVIYDSYTQTVQLFHMLHCTDLAYHGA